MQRFLIILFLVIASPSGWSADSGSQQSAGMSATLDWQQPELKDDLDDAHNVVFGADLGNENLPINSVDYVGPLAVPEESGDTNFAGFDLLEAPIYTNSTYQDSSRILEPKALVSGIYPTRVAFNPDGSGEISRTLNWSVDSDVFSWEITGSPSLLTLNLQYGSGTFTTRTLTTPTLGENCGADSDDRQRDIDTYGDEYVRLLAFVTENPGPYSFEAACQIEVHFWTEKITHESMPDENWRVITYNRQALILTQDLLDAGWDGPSTLVSVAPAVYESIQYPRQYNEADLTYSVFAEPTGKWVLPIYADPTGARELDSALIFSEEMALTQTDPEFSPAPNFGTALSYWSGYDFNWELDEQALVLENEDLRLQYRVLDKQDDILLLEFGLTDKRSGEHFTVAERGAKFDGTGEESASQFQVEPPLYYQSLLNGKPSFVETPGTCDWVNGALFVNQNGVYRFFMNELQDCRFLVSTGLVRDAEIVGNSLFMSPRGVIYSSGNRRREWRVVATLEDDRLMIIESSRFLDESLNEQGYDFMIYPRTTIVEIDDLSLSGEAWLTLDIDGDGLTNREEADLGTAYGQADSDADGLTDSEELSLGTSPLLPDTDADGLNDSEEINLGTNPLLRDSDSDGWSDGEEVAAGTDPLDDSSKPKQKRLPGIPGWLMYELSEPSERES